MADDWGNAVRYNMYHIKAPWKFKLFRVLLNRTWEVSIT